MNRKNESKGNHNGHGSGHIRVRVIDLDIAGNNDTLSDGLKALTSALTRTPASTPPARPVLPSAPKQSSVAVLEEEDVSHSNVEDTPPTIAEEDGQETEFAPNDNGKKRNYTFRPPQFMNDLDLSKAKKSLVEFVSEKGELTSLSDKYLVVAVWLKEYMSIDEFTIHHIFTAFDNLGWKNQMPIDHSQPLRDLKTKKHHITKEKGSKGYKVNWQGSQYVANLGVKKQ